MKILKSIVLTSLAFFSVCLSGCSYSSTPSVPRTDECLNHYDSDNDGFCDYCDEEMPTEKQTFTGITFKGETFNYDGKEHSIYVKGAPDFATVTYSNNGKVDVGTYSVEAKIRANGYISKILYATLKIKGMKFEGISFKDLTVDYDSKPHTIEATGVPDFATVEYSGGNKISIGEYRVSATISAKNYETLTLYATLTIKGKQFTGITFKDQDFAYDGSYHYIYVEGAPDFADVTYKNNGHYDKGSYIVTATITAAGYETMVLKATMTISKRLPKAILEDRTLIYIGSNQPIIYKLPDDLPRATEVLFKVDGKTVEEESFVVKTVGQHTASITLSNTTYDYSSSTVTATIKVINNNIGGVDSSKTPLTINKDLKYQTLRSKILEGNFTIKEEYFDDFFYPDGSTKYELDHTKITYVNGDEVFSYSYYSEYDSLIETLTDYRHTKLSNGEVKSAYFEDGILNGSYYESSYKFDEIYYQENVIGRIGLEAIAWLKESSDGGFEDGCEGGYHKKYGSFTIDSANNRFIEDTRIHYSHSEWDHDEHSRYTIYNIGNTTVNVPDDLNALKISDDKFYQKDFLYIDGFEYSFYDDYVNLDPVMDAVSVAYLPKGTYEIPACINDLPVLKISIDYYAPNFDNDCSGYTFKLYFDSYGYYQGEYESLGRISNYNKIYELEYDGATIHFYDKWH